MRILIDIGHPAHVHYFKYFANDFFCKGHKVFFTCREKEVTTELLRSYNYDFISLGKPFKSLVGKILGLFYFNSRILIISLRNKPDLFLSAGSMYAAQVAWLLRKPHIALEDTGNMEQIRLYAPFTKAILTPESFHKDLGKRQFRLKYYNELTYLHPDKFTPNEDIKTLLGLKPAEQFILIRFVSWDATHDLGNRGISDTIKRKLIDLLRKRYKVFISSENKLPDEFEKYKIQMPADKIHDVLSAAELYIGEGATMASECAMLGTPAIYINPLYAGTINEQEKYGLLFHFKTDHRLIEKVEELIKIPDLKSQFRLKRDKMLSDKIDFTGFLVWFVENWPESYRVMRENPEYQKKFRSLSD